MKKMTFYTELAYIPGIFFVAFGAALMAQTDLGVSMIVAPAYLLFRVINPFLGFFTFGMAEYCFQALLLIIMMIILRRFRISFLFSFATVVIYGIVLDSFMALTALFPTGEIWQKILWYIIGLVFCCSGISFMFHTYLSPEVYELFVKEVSAHFHISLTKFKTCYDISSFLTALIMSFIFFGFGNFVGIGVGTVITAFINGFLISRFSILFEKIFIFKDRLPFRPFFTDIALENEEE